MPFPIAAAIELAAEFGPGLVRWIAGEKAGDVANEVADIAERVTGTDDASAAAKAMRENPQLALEFRKQADEIEQRELDAYMKDRRNARARDVAIRQSGQRNSRADLMVAGAGAILIACLVALVSYKADLPGEAVGIISTIAGIAGACLKDAFSFEFGSSRGSKEKDGIMAAMK
jgi:hypothetical protein